MDGQDAVCPFCHKAIRSDADAPEFCALCAMGVDHPELAPKLISPYGKTLYFCCSWCLRIYVREIPLGRDCHKPQEGKGEEDVHI